MTEISHETGRQVGVLINRKGQVDYVMVGTAKGIELPDFGRARVSEDRFRGLRCVHTHLLGEKLTQDDLTDLALLRLDLMSIIQVDRKDGLPGTVYSAHLVPTTAEGFEAEGGADQEIAGREPLDQHVPHASTEHLGARGREERQRGPFPKERDELGVDLVLPDRRAEEVERRRISGNPDPLPHRHLGVAPRRARLLDHAAELLEGAHGIGADASNFRVHAIEPEVG